MITYQNAFDIWAAEIRPAVIQQYGADDVPALSESWNDYTDGLCKDGDFTDLQYRYCPAWDDDMPEDDAEFILKRMGAAFASLYISERPDGLMTDMPAGATHWRILIKRGGHDMTIYYSMGPAHSGTPQSVDVFQSLLMDTSDIEDVDFEEWAENLGWDSDSRRAERAFKACQGTLLQLRTLFSESELGDLREIFADR